MYFKQLLIQREKINFRNTVKKWVNRIQLKWIKNLWFKNAMHFPRIDIYVMRCYCKYVGDIFSLLNSDFNQNP